MDSQSQIDRLIDDLLRECEQPRNEAKKSAPDPKFTVYLENIGWAQLFGYDMNRYYGDPAFQLETQLRQRLYHWQSFDDDTPLSSSFEAMVGMYAEFSLFDMPVRHEAVGVPHIRDDHPMTQDPDLSLLQRHDFHTTGQMPDLIKVWETLRELAAGRLDITFPVWSRGPLDIAIQLRGYDNFVADTVERPQFVHDLLRFIVEERMRWWDERAKFIGPSPSAAGISDDWVNVPFISPAIFEDFCLPRYLELEQYHGQINRLHSCGDKSPLVHIILQIKTLDSFEVNHWTPLDLMIERVPADKHLAYAFQNLDVLIGTEAEQEAKIRAVVEACAGRRYSLCGQALQRVSDSYAHDIEQVKQFVRVARRVLGRPGESPN